MSIEKQKSKKAAQEPDSTETKKPKGSVSSAEGGEEEYVEEWWEPYAFPFILFVVGPIIVIAIFYFDGGPALCGIPVLVLAVILLKNIQQAVLRGHNKKKE